MVNKQQQQQRPTTTTRTSSRIRNKACPPSPSRLQNNQISSSKDSSNHQTAKMSSDQVKSPCNKMELDSIKSLEYAFDIFIQLILQTTPQDRKRSLKEKRLTNTEQVPWNQIRTIGNDFISSDQDTSQQDLILKHNLAQLFVMLIESPEKLIQKDFSPLLDSLLMRTMKPDKTKNDDLVNQSLNLIVELEAYKFISYQNQSHAPDTNDGLFAPSGKAWKSLTDYQLSQACQVLIGENESCWFDQFCNQVTNDIAASLRDPSRSTQRFSPPKLVSFCIAVIQEVNRSTQKSDSPQTRRSPSEKVPRRISPAEEVQSNISDGSDHNNGSDDFQDDALVAQTDQVASEAPPPAQDSNQTTDPSNRSRTLIQPELEGQAHAGLSFEERHHRTVAPGSSGQGILSKLVREAVKDPNVVSKLPSKARSGALLQTSAPSMREVETATLLPTKSSSKDTATPPITRSRSKPTPPVFCFNAPQKDATQIPFESLRPESHPSTGNTSRMSIEPSELSHAASFDVQETQESSEDSQIAHRLVPAQSTPKQPGIGGSVVGPLEDDQLIVADTQDSSIDTHHLDSLAVSGLSSDRLVGDALTDKHAPSSDLPRNREENILSSASAQPIEGSNCDIGAQQESKKGESADIETDPPSLKEGFRDITVPQDPSVEKSRQADDSRSKQQSKRPPAWEPPLRGRKAQEHHQPASSRQESRQPLDQSEDPGAGEQAPKARSANQSSHKKKATRKRSPTPTDSEEEEEEDRPLSKKKTSPKRSSPPTNAEEEDQLEYSEPEQKVSKASSSKQKQSKKEGRKKVTSKRGPTSAVTEESESGDREMKKATKTRKMKREGSACSAVPERKRKRRTVKEEEGGRSYMDHRIIARAQSGPRRRTFWSPDEEKLFIKEVVKWHAKSNCMAQILKRHGPNGSVSETFAHRNSVHLKDKAINLSTKWYRDDAKLPKKVRHAFSRFPPKGQFVFPSSSSSEESEAETGSLLFSLSSSGPEEEGSESSRSAAGTKQEVGSRSRRSKSRRPERDRRRPASRALSAATSPSPPTRPPSPSPQLPDSLPAPSPQQAPLPIPQPPRDTSPAAAESPLPCL